MLTLYPILPGHQEQSDGHFHLLVGKSSALLRSHWLFQDPEF